MIEFIQGYQMGDKSSILKVQSYFRKLIAHCSLLARRSPGGLIAQKGFTLIEAIIVMVIVAILAAVAIIKNPFDTIKRSSATRKVAEDIRYVQKLSISNQTRAGIEFNANGYCVFQNITLRTGACLPVVALATSPGDPCSTNASKQFVVDFTDASRCSNYSGVTLTASATNPFAFNSLGSLVDTAGNALVTQTVSVGGNAITIEAGTGRVSY